MGSAVGGRRGRAPGCALLGGVWGEAQPPHPTGQGLGFPKPPGSQIRASSASFPRDSAVPPCTARPPPGTSPCHHPAWEAPGSLGAEGETEAQPPASPRDGASCSSSGQRVRATRSHGMDTARSPRRPLPAGDASHHVPLEHRLPDGAGGVRRNLRRVPPQSALRPGRVAGEPALVSAPRRGVGAEPGGGGRAAAGCTRGKALGRGVLWVHPALLPPPAVTQSSRRCGGRNARTPFIPMELRALLCAHPAPLPHREFIHGPDAFCSSVAQGLLSAMLERLRSAGGDGQQCHILQQISSVEVRGSPVRPSPPTPIPQTPQPPPCSPTGPPHASSCPPHTAHSPFSVGLWVSPSSLCVRSASPRSPAEC